MIGIDANVLVRYLAQDDAHQAARATAFIESLSSEAPGFLPVVALVETVWVLSRAYQLPRPHLAVLVEQLLRTRELVVEHAHAARLALARYQSGEADFADALIAETARLAGRTETVTFDRKAAARAGMRLLAG